MELRPETRRGLMDLYSEFPPLPIENGQDLAATQSVVDGLLDRDRGEAEELYLHVLGTLISEYEDRTEPTYELTGLALVRERLRTLGRSEQDLVAAGVFASESIAKNAVGGTRPLTLDEVRGLARYFHLPADLLLREPQVA